MPTVTRPRPVRISLNRKFANKWRPQVLKDGNYNESSGLGDGLRVSIHTKSDVSSLKMQAISNPHHVALNDTVQTFTPPIAIITSLPNPTPDTELITTNSVGVGSPLLGIISSNSETMSPTTISPATAASLYRTHPASSFSALPPLQSLAVTLTMTTTGYTKVLLPSQTSLPTPAQSKAFKSHQVTLVVAILLSVGCALLLLGGCIITKIYAKPKRQSRPTPSLPVLNDIENNDDFYETKGSPVFGGDERMTSNPAASGPIWTWVQYPQRKGVSLSSNDAPPPPINPQNSQHSNPGGATTSAASTQASANSFRQGSLQNIPSVFVSSNKRLSSAYNLTNEGMNEAEGIYEATYHRDRHEDFNGTKSKSNKRKSQLGLEEKRNRNSANSFVGLAYDTEVDSPDSIDYIQAQETPILNNEFEGRAKVKSGYFAAGAYPRISTNPSTAYSIATATRVNVAHRNSFSRDKYPLQKTHSKKSRDTQALTYALGLASPRTDYGVSSPQPSLYPDDSMSQSDAKQLKKRNQGERKVVETTPDIPVILPMEKEINTTGPFMAMDFEVGPMSLMGLALEQSEGSRNTDKPPRVPSPPPLPSLTQMGLAHNNPESYASYRSPTYSMYGLYENPDRKSIVR